MQADELKQLESRAAEARKVERLCGQISSALAKFDDCVSFTVNLLDHPHSWIEVRMTDELRPMGVCFANDHPELRDAIRLAVRETLVKRFDELNDQFAKI